MLDIFTVVFSKLKNKKNTNHDTTGSTSTGGGRSTSGSTNHISGPYPQIVAPLTNANSTSCGQLPQPRSLPYPPTTNHDSSSTPLSFNSSGNQNNGSFPDENNIYTTPNVSVQRRTPIVNGTMALDDMSGQLEDPFKRSAKARMSLPIMQRSQVRNRQSFAQLPRRNQLPPQSMGHIYLQYKGETKQANLPNELTTIDTVWALFVCAFPNLLTMDYMSQPHVKIYIYNPNCNIFYELRDIDEIKHESVLRIHQSDPLLALPPQYHRLAQHQLPPPKPRRMIPMYQIQSNVPPPSNTIYGIPGANAYQLPPAPMHYQPHQQQQRQRPLPLPQQQHFQQQYQQPQQLQQQQQHPQYHHQLQQQQQPQQGWSNISVGSQACLPLTGGI